MSLFARQLEEFAQNIPEFKRPVENIMQDLYDLNHPHFEGYKKLRECLDQDIQELQQQDNVISEPQWQKIILENCSIKRPESHVKAVFSEHEIRRVTTWTSFLKFNLSDPRNSSLMSNRITKIWAKRLRKVISEKQNNEMVLEADQLSGETSALGYPSWWSWRQNNTHNLIKGKELCELLALTDEIKEKGRDDKAVLEIVLNKNELLDESPKYQTYRTTGLDDFRPTTLFRPNPIDEPFGRTYPSQNPEKGLPEAVTEPVCFDELPDDFKVTINLIPYHDEE